MYRQAAGAWSWTQTSGARRPHRPSTLHHRGRQIRYINKHKMKHVYSMLTLKYCFHRLLCCSKDLHRPRKAGTDASRVLHFIHTWQAQPCMLNMPNLTNIKLHNTKTDASLNEKMQYFNKYICIKYNHLSIWTTSIELCYTHFIQTSIPLRYLQFSFHSFNYYFKTLYFIKSFIQIHYHSHVSQTNSVNDWEWLESYLITNGRIMKRVVSDIEAELTNIKGDTVVDKDLRS